MAPFLFICLFVSDKIYHTLCVKPQLEFLISEIVIRTHVINEARS